jgi:hypothetical protein
VLDIDIERMHIDFLAMSGYKWLKCPVGSEPPVSEKTLPKLSQSQAAGSARWIAAATTAAA